MKKIAYLLIFLLACFRAGAQDINDQNIIEGAPLVFLDCSWQCDFDIIRNGMNLVNFVRERQSADVQVLVTSQGIGSGGERISLYFTGLKHFEGMKDTIFVETTNDATGKEINDQIIKGLKQGLLAYIAQSPIRDKIQYSLRKSNKSNNNKETVIDPWNSWVFNTSIGGYLSAESNYNNYSLRGNISANRITNTHKIYLWSNANYRASNFYTRDSFNTILDSLTITSLRNSASIGGSYIYSLAPHWSIGVFPNISTNLFNNYKLSIEAIAGIEYNYFLYQESDRRQLILQYKIGPRYFHYVDTTIYGNIKERRFLQSISANLYQKQNWGSLAMGASFSNYLKDIHLNRLVLYSEVNWNIVKGLTIGFNGSISFISDQINLPKDAPDIPETLLRTRLLATNYSLFGYFNIRYTFGSKYNNVVNSRFSSGGGRTYFFF